MRFSRMRGEAGRLERDLRAERPEPRSDFLLSMSKELSKNKAPRRASRVAFALALTTFVVGTFASFGGVGYAASGAVSAVKVVKKAVADKPRSLSQSSAQAQYGPAEPPSQSGTEGENAGAAAGQVATVNSLPFTGISLGITVALGLALLAAGLALRRAEKQRN